MVGLYEERYSGFTVKHFHEQLQKQHHYKLGYTVTRLALQGGGAGAAGAAALGASQEAAAAADGGHDAAPRCLALRLAAGG
jgi:hypothetical protein